MPMAPPPPTVPHQNGRAHNTQTRGVALRRHNSGPLALIILCLCAGAAAVASLKFGVRSVEISDVLAALQSVSETTEQAAAYLRIPRTVLGFVVGACLAVAGTTFQTITRNPLADPGIFGVLSGAAFAVVIGLVFFHLARPLPTMAVAIVGAFLAAMFVYAVGSMGAGGPTPLKLALSGAATAAALSSLTSALLLPRADVMDRFRFWQIGSIGGAEWRLLAWATPFLILGVVILAVYTPQLNALALGDATASSLGIDVTRARVVTTIAAVVLCGSATALAGPIAFIGLIIPHACRQIIGTDHRWLLPTAALAGGILVVGADTIGRLIARPEEIAVGILTPVIGAPVFIWIIYRTKVREL